MEESKTHIPLVTRLDHLDLVMKSLEGKQEITSRWGGGGGESGISLDMAAREAYFKGSLMDRVAFLERRLFQLCLEMESNSMSRSSGTSSSTKALKSNIIPLQDSTAPIPQPIKEKVHKEEERKDSKAKELKSGKNNKKSSNGEKEEETNTSKTGKKRTPPRWPHIKILGC
ncbi:uncharacterized protein [Euphorbia lathyris]|uniref:uncharacterized protein n=1 Tax=Euphorbia lathyris TaxID=212925 RepID=UPI0033142A19